MTGDNHRNESVEFMEVNERLGNTEAIATHDRTKIKTWCRCSSDGEVCNFRKCPQKENYQRWCPLPIANRDGTVSWPDGVTTEMD